MGQSQPQFPANLRLIHQQNFLQFYQSNHQQYLLLQTLICHQHPITQILHSRSQLVSVPKLYSYHFQSYSLCNQFTLLKILFIHPSKTLHQQLHNRKDNNLKLTEGELWMVIYCTVLCLKQYKKFNKCYEVTINDKNIYIAEDGNIVLSDAGSIQKQIKSNKSKYSYNFYQTGLQRGQIIKIKIMIEKIIDMFQGYSEEICQFVAKLGNIITTYQDAISIMKDVKKKKGLSQQDLNCNKGTPKRNTVSPITQLLHSKCYLSSNKSQNTTLNKQNSFKKQHHKIKSIKNQQNSCFKTKVYQQKFEQISSIAQNNKVTQEDDIFQLIQSIQPIQSKIYSNYNYHNQQKYNSNVTKMQYYNPREIIYEVSEDASETYRTHTRMPSNALSQSYEEYSTQNKQ